MKKSVFARSKRSLALIFFMFAIGAIFIIRLYQLQITQHAYYEAEGFKEHLAKFTIPAKRGLIYARDGENIAPLVLNEPTFLAYADPRYVKNVDNVAATLRNVAGGNVVDNLESKLGNKQKQYVVVAKQLSEQQEKMLKDQNLSGIGFKSQERRVYPEGTLAAQTLGYVNGDGQGQYGFEGAVDDQLSGKPGTLKTVTDVRGIPISLSDKDVDKPAQDGTNFVLTIDRNIQSYAEQALKNGLDNVKAKHGSVLVMDPNSGAVLAMANLPSYDPAKFYDLGQNDYSVYQNPVVSDPYEPGSVIKTLTMATGLNEGAVKPDTIFANTGAIKVGDFTITNVHQDVNGTRSMTEILQYSLNTGVVYILQQLGGGNINKTAREKLYDYFSNRFMLGKSTGIEQSGESKGTFIDPNNVQGNDIRFANNTFGQGIDVTMLQVASAYSAMVNGGAYYKPHLVYGSFKGQEGVQAASPEVVKNNVVKPFVTDAVKDMMKVSRQKAFPNKDKAGYYVGGKTGTSQIIDQKTGKYIDSNAVGSYLGFGGNNTPKYVIMVRVVDSQAPGYAGSVAAEPIFSDISNWLIDYLKIQPIR